MLWKIKPFFKVTNIKTYLGNKAQKSFWMNESIDECMTKGRIHFKLCCQRPWQSVYGVYLVEILYMEANKEANQLL